MRFKLGKHDDGPLKPVRPLNADGSILPKTRGEFLDAVGAALSAMRGTQPILSSKVVLHLVAFTRPKRTDPVH